MSSLNIDNLRSSFGATEVLRGLNLTVPSGEVCAVLGPSGCGKTTLLRIIAGFDLPRSGRVRLADRILVDDRTWTPPEKRRITVVPQEGALFPHLSVGANVAFGLKGPKRQRASRVAELLELVGIGGLAERFPEQLSGGQQQRVALARALAPQPELILMDEPFSGLDAGLRGQVRADVREVLRLTGATALLVTHDQTEALSVADTLAVMADGQVLMQGSPQQVYLAPTSLAVARFLGDLVELPGETTNGMAQTVFGRHELQSRVTPSSGPGIVCLRPEQLILSAEGTAARKIRREYLGPQARITLEVPAPHGPLTVTAITSGETADADIVQLTVRGPVGFFPS